MITCQNCYNGTEPYVERRYWYSDWLDITLSNEYKHGRYCDCCGEEYQNNQIVVLTEKDIDNKEFGYRNLQGRYEK